MQNTAENAGRTCEAGMWPISPEAHLKGPGFHLMITAYLFLL